MITKLGNEYIRSLAADGDRADGRAFDEFRDLEIETGYAKNAEGSALVTLGDTKVLVGVKMSVGSPYPDSQDEGALMVNCELSPKASPDFETGPPREEAVEISRVIDRGVRESKAIDVKDLCIEEGEKCWLVQVDIDVINDAGNLLDASGIGAIAALHDTSVPELDEDTRPVFGTETRKLSVSEIPVPVTVFKVGNVLMLDADYQEGNAADARLTSTAFGGEYFCSMQQGGEGNFTSDEVLRAAEMSMEKANQLTEQVKKAIGA